MQPLTRRRLAGSLVLLVFGGIIATRAVTEPKNDFHFSIMGDRTGGAAPEVWGRVWREVDLLHPDFVINVGDTIEGGRDDRAQAEWNALRPTFVRYGHFPLYFTPGNHDVFSDTSAKIYVQETRRPLFYSFNYQDAHFTVLDNSRTTDLTQEQMEFLERDLEAHRDRRPKFVFFHKPFWIVPLKLRSGEFPLHQTALRHGVEYVISGHGHQFVRLQRDGVTYMEVGSSGGTMQRGLQRGEGFREGWFYHHVWARVKGGKVSFTVKEIDGPKGHGRIFRAEEWGEEGPQFDIHDPASIDKPET
ncbi:MAG: metallophosphoesterase [Bryobacteraceae bacterium]|nr:metallophosphoesterase [Bryobacteraceae bacterium]